LEKKGDDSGEGLVIRKNNSETSPRIRKRIKGRRLTRGRKKE